jgi:hypothetical protein
MRNFLRQRTRSFRRASDFRLEPHNLKSPTPCDEGQRMRGASMIHLRRSDYPAWGYSDSVNPAAAGGCGTTSYSIFHEPFRLFNVFGTEPGRNLDS